MEYNTIQWNNYLLPPLLNIYFNKSGGRRSQQHGGYNGNGKLLFVINKKY